MPKNYFSLPKTYTPRDKIAYQIPQQAIQDTSTILKEYGRNEGLVYWAGTKEGLIVTVKAVIAPKTTFSWGNVSVSHKSNYNFVGALSKNNLIHLAQVHSHPSEWVGHSPGDNVMAAFKVEGLLSIVVPQYCQNGMLPLSRCGVHRFTKGTFKWLSNKYVESHFELTDKTKSILEDQRK